MNEFTENLVYVVLGQTLPFIGETVESNEWIAGVFSSLESAKAFVNDAMNDAADLLKEWRNIDNPNDYIEYNGPQEGRVDDQFCLTTSDVTYRIETHSLRNYP